MVWPSPTLHFVKATSARCAILPGNLHLMKFRKNARVQIEIVKTRRNVALIVAISAVRVSSISKVIKIVIEEED